MYIIKASGDRGKFDPDRVYRTCVKAGADNTLANKVLDEIKKNIYNGITTQEILRLILRLLKQDSPAVATRYNLKKAMLHLGPGGFVFEKFIARLLKTYEYKAWHPEIMRGACVNHEIDVIATPVSSVESLPWIKTRLDSTKARQARKKSIYMIECKYHNAAGIRCGLKVAMYTWARFLDLKQAWRHGYGKRFDYPWLISNTKFSQSAKGYAHCKKMRLLGWKYPENTGLEYLVEKNKVYPITILRNLDRLSRKTLLENDIILCQDLVDTKKDILQRKTKIKHKKLTALLNEARLIV